jgi:uncharacterized protein (TIGR00255 family)
MIRSMTAYGSAKRVTPSGKWAIEVHSVNRKGLDLNLFLPRELLSFDPEVRKILAQEIQRGLVTLRVNFEPEQIQGPLLSLKAIKEKWDKIARELGFRSSDAIDLRFLIERMKEEVVIGDGKEFKVDLFTSISEALKKFIEMREKEGSALRKDFILRLKTIRTQLKKIEKKAPLLQEKYQKKLKARITEVASLDKDRLLREVMIYAERVDVTEEITRLYSHMTQFEDLLRAKEKSVGRTLDFLTQEMGREINTLTAKAGDSEISKLAIGIKSEIEKIREQVQNIE